MKHLAKFMVSGALSLCVLAPVLAQADVVHVVAEWEDPAHPNQDLFKFTWDQSVPATVINSSNDNYNDVAISPHSFSSTKPNTPTYTDVTWFSVLNNQGGGFDLFDPNTGHLDYIVSGPQAYTEPASSPGFPDGIYMGTDFDTKGPVKYTLTLVVSQFEI